MPDRVNIHSRLEEVLQRDGDLGIMRWFEINSPNDGEEFLRRLYKEMKRLVDHLESTAQDKQEDSEDKITRYVVGLLHQTGYQATHDQDQRGHTDLLVWSGDFKWLAEAKLHSNYGWLCHGLRQLQSYATGRENGYGLLIYIRVQDARSVMDEWRKRLTESTDNYTKSVHDGDADESLTFWSIHQHNASGADMNTKHIGVSLYYASPLR